MPFLTDQQIQTLVTRAVKKALLDNGTAAKKNEQRQVAELTGTADEPKGFAKACAESGARAHAEKRTRLIARLNSSSGYVTESDLDQLRWEFRGVHDLEALIADKAAGNRVG